VDAERYGERFLTTRKKRVRFHGSNMEKPKRLDDGKKEKEKK
jgi:hypothetical protein